MIGLRYIMFVKDTQHKELADKLGVSAQMITNWFSGIKPIAEKHLPKLEEFYGVSKEYFQKELTLQDKMEIEMQLTTKSGKYESIDFQAVELHKQNQNVKEKYLEILSVIEDYARTMNSLEEEVEEFFAGMSRLMKVESLMNDPDGCEIMFEQMKRFQAIRKLVKM